MKNKTTLKLKKKKKKPWDTWFSGKLNNRDWHTVKLFQQNLLYLKKKTISKRKCWGNEFSKTWLPLQEPPPSPSSWYKVGELLDWVLAEKNYLRRYYMFPQDAEGHSLTKKKKVFWLFSSCVYYSSWDNLSLSLSLSNTLYGLLCKSS